MKKLVETGVISPREAINITMRGASYEKVRALGSTQNVLRILRRHVKNSINPKPYKYLELELSEILTITHSKAQFYQYGLGNYRGLEVSDDIVFFYSHEMVSELNWHDCWSVEATFSIVPSPYYQLFTISFIEDHHVFPCVFVLMKNKEQQTYETMWRILKSMHFICHPSVIKTDFEAASINALTVMFPQANISGCLFHLGQAIQRKVQNLFLFTRYRKEQTIRTYVKYLTALSFVEIEKVEMTFFQILEDKKFPKCLIALYNYFYSNYIKADKVRFPQKLWHIRDIMDHNLPRTNNGIEGWHSIFKKSFGSSRYSLPLLFFKLKEEEDCSRRKWFEYRLGIKLYKKKKYLDLENELAKFFTNYEGVNYGIDFIDKLSEKLYY